MPHLKTTRISNYEGFKRLDKMLEKVATGKLKPPRPAATGSFCPLCHCVKRSQVLVPSMVLGVPVSRLGTECRTQFVGKFVVVCQDCADDLKRAKVQ